jgi:hypothetical protein
MPHTMVLPPHWPWVLAIALVLLVTAVVKFRRHRLRVLAVGSVALGISCVVAYPVSWNTNRVVRLWWQIPLANGNEHEWNLYLSISRGGTEFWAKKRIALRDDVLAEAKLHDKLAIRLGWATGPNLGRYPNSGSSLRITRDWPLVERAGFNADWQNDPNLKTGVPSLYGVTVPLWFFLLLCPWAPLILYRRRNRRRHRQANGLCLTCGYDLRAHNRGDKCLECATPVPVPVVNKLSAIPASSSTARSA